MSRGRHSYYTTPVPYRDDDSQDDYRVDEIQLLNNRSGMNLATPNRGPPKDHDSAERQSDGSSSDGGRKLQTLLKNDKMVIDPYIEHPIAGFALTGINVVLGSFLIAAHWGYWAKNIGIFGAGAIRTMGAFTILGIFATIGAIINWLLSSILVKRPMVRGTRVTYGIIGIFLLRDTPIFICWTIALTNRGGFDDGFQGFVFFFHLLYFIPSILLSWLSYSRIFAILLRGYELNATDGKDDENDDDDDRFERPKSGGYGHYLRSLDQSERSLRGISDPLLSAETPGEMTDVLSQSQQEQTPKQTRRKIGVERYYDDNGVYIGDAGFEASSGSRAGRTPNDRCPEHLRRREFVYHELPVHVKPGSPAAMQAPSPAKMVARWSF